MDAWTVWDHSCHPCGSGTCSSCKPRLRLWQGHGHKSCMTCSSFRHASSVPPQIQERARSTILINMRLCHSCHDAKPAVSVRIAYVRSIGLKCNEGAVCKGARALRGFVRVKPVSATGGTSKSSRAQHPCPGQTVFCSSVNSVNLQTLPSNEFPG